MNPTDKSINPVYPFIASLVSFLIFIISSGTAYEWPTMDMFPFFERKFDPSFLANDFYTNSITNSANPRYPFGYLIIGLSKLLHVEWYTMAYMLKVLFVVTLPVLYFHIVFLLAQKLSLNRPNEILILLGILAVMHPLISGTLSVAWWTPWFVQINPQTVALVLVLTGILLREREVCYAGYFFMLLSALAVCIHPSMGVFVIVFYLIITYKSMIKEPFFLAGVFIVSMVLPLGLLLVFFGPEKSLDAKTFIEIYILQNHADHYHAADFGKLSPLPWYASFIVMEVLLLLPMVWFYRQGRLHLVFVGLLMMASCAAALAAQYIFVDVIPVKFIAAFSPVRFLQLMYWMIAILWVILLSELQWVKQYLNVSVKLPKWLVPACLVVLFTIGVSRIDAPWESRKAQHKDFYAFVSGTDRNSVFAAYFGDYMYDIPNIGGRAVFSGNGFPFNETYFEEHQHRKEFLYGSKAQRDAIEGRWTGEKIANFFRKRTPADFIKMASVYQLDYVVVEKLFSDAFANSTPVYENNELKVFAIKDLK